MLAPVNRLLYSFSSPAVAAAKTATPSLQGVKLPVKGSVEKTPSDRKGSQFAGEGSGVTVAGAHSEHPNSHILPNGGVFGSDSIERDRNESVAAAGAPSLKPCGGVSGPLEEAGKAKETGDDQSIGDSVSGAGFKDSLANGVLDKRRDGEEQRNGEERQEGDRGHGAAEEGGTAEEGGAAEEAEEKQWWEDSDDDEGDAGEGDMGTGGLRDGDGVTFSGERDRAGSGGSSTGKAVCEDSLKSHCEEGGQLEKAPHVQEAGQLKKALRLEEGEEEGVVVEISVETKLEGTCEGAAAVEGETAAAVEGETAAAVGGVRGESPRTELISTGTAEVVVATVASVSDGVEEGSNGMVSCSAVESAAPLLVAGPGPVDRDFESTQQSSCGAVESAAPLLVADLGPSGGASAGGVSDVVGCAGTGVKGGKKKGKKGREGKEGKERRRAGEAEERSMGMRQRIKEIGKGKLDRDCKGECSEKLCNSSGGNSRDCSSNDTREGSGIRMEEGGGGAAWKREG
ncbi:unnamed protein product [Closterium sp. NIES-53]